MIAILQSISNRNT